jgi:hypothetical protein
MLIMIVDTIGNLNMHDSELLRILIERTDITMLINYIDDYETQKTSRKTLIFRDCTNFVMKTHLGYASPDSILGAKEITIDRERRISIETNTTATTIEIIANLIELVDDSEATNAGGE